MFLVVKLLCFGKFRNGKYMGMLGRVVLGIFRKYLELQI